MLEQIITSILFVLLNLSIYYFVNGKGVWKNRVKYSLIAQLLVFISFAIPFPSESFIYKHNLVLLFYSLGLGVFYLMLIFMSKYIIPFQILILKKNVSSKERMAYSNNIIRFLCLFFLLLIIIFDLVMIWDENNFTALVNDLFSLNQ